MPTSAMASKSCSTGRAALADDQKVGLIGRNGAGKSTLCRVLLGEEELDKGEVVRGRNLRLGYLRQHDPFKPGETVREFLMRDSGQPDWRCGEVAWQFQFPDAMLDRPVRELSGGWQTRTKLAALLLHDPNLLILDEPTNFLDLRTQMLLEHFLQEYDGGCLIVSHDREFLKKTCTHTLELCAGQLTMYPGNVDAYLANVEERLEHDRRVNATTLSKRRQLETFITKNRARASTATQAKSKAKQLERLELIHVEGPEANVRFRFPDIEAAAGAGCADATSRDRLSGSHRCPRRARGDRSRHARRHRRRQRPGQDDVPADRMRIAAAGFGRSRFGATAARSAFTPSTSTRRCPNRRRCSSIWNIRPLQTRSRSRSKTWPAACCSAAR